jgi:hypothetical protein
LFIYLSCMSAVARVVTSHLLLAKVSGSYNPRRRRLILDGLACSTPSRDTLARAPDFVERVYALSSFQRTKASADVNTSSGGPNHLRYCFGGARQGNLTSLPHFCGPCQSLRRRTGLKTVAVEPGIFLGSHCAFDRRRRVKRVIHITTHGNPCQPGPSKVALTVPRNSKITN